MVSYVFIITKANECSGVINKQKVPHIMHSANFELKVLEKKCALYTGKYGTVNHKKGTMKVTDAHKQNLKELEIIWKMRQDTMKNLPQEISVHLNEGGLHL